MFLFYSATLHKSKKSLGVFGFRVGIRGKVRLRSWYWGGGECEMGVKLW